MRPKFTVARLPAAALLLGALVLLVMAAAASAQTAKGVKEQRIALVIGNGDYKASPLGNPVNDARAMSDALQKTGFTVVRKENASLKEMTLALRDFGDKLKKGGVGLFYYAGHGMAVKGRNFLIPVDAQIEREDEIAFNALDANAVLDKMESAGNRLNLVILDACRNNPFARSFRSGSQGLAQMDAPVGTLVAFATAPGQVASDGNGKNGLYTQHLLANMTRPGQKIEDLFKAVRVNVRRESNGSQVPWEASSLEGDFYFVPAALVAVPAPAPSVPPPSVPAPAAPAPGAGKPGAQQVAGAAKPGAQPPVAGTAKPGAASPQLAAAPPTSAAAAAGAAGNATAPSPNPQGRAVPVAFPPGAPVLKPGDTWTYRHFDLRSDTSREVTNLVEEVLPDHIRFHGGNYTTDLAQGVLYDRSKIKDRVVETRFDPGMPILLFPQRIGESKSGTVLLTRGDGDKSEEQYVIKVIRREKVTVPAGTFDAIYSEREIIYRQRKGSRSNTGINRMRIWYAPEVKRFVKFENGTFDATGKLVPFARRELLSYQLTP